MSQCGSFSLTFPTIFVAILLAFSISFDVKYPSSSSGLYFELSSDSASNFIILLLKVFALYPELILKFSFFISNTTIDCFHPSKSVGITYPTPFPPRVGAIKAM